MTDHLDVLDRLRMEDPLLRGGVDLSPERMSRLRRSTDPRRNGWVPDPVLEGRPATGRWLKLSAAAAVLAVLGSAGLSLVPPEGGPSLAVTSVALAKDGRLTCNPANGFGGPIDLADSPVRLLPGWLPAGWRIGHVWAFKEIESTCYQHPSLVLAETAASGEVTRSAMVFGPIPEPITVEEQASDARPATIAGQPGQLIVRASPKGPDELLWVWTDPAGDHWLMRSYGYAPDTGRRLAGALRTDGTTISLDPGLAPKGTWTVHERTTATPYPARTPSYHWSVTLGTGALKGRDGEVTLEAISTPAGTFGLDGVFPGQLLSGSGAQLQVRQYAYGGLNLLRPEAGLTIVLMPNWVRGGEPTLGSMTPQEWERVVTGLEQVPSDSPRLPDLELDE